MTCDQIQVQRAMLEQCGRSSIFVVDFEQSIHHSVKLARTIAKCSQK